jgi:hypothetical protein
MVYLEIFSCWEAYFFICILTSTSVTLKYYKVSGCKKEDFTSMIPVNADAHFPSSGKIQRLKEEKEVLSVRT